MASSFSRKDRRKKLLLDEEINLGALRDPFLGRNIERKVWSLWVFEI